jgi:protein-S-isoprenylcysteine O-methyltransferase Ste14
MTAHVAAAVSSWRHARAIALLPFMNTVVIPGVLLTLFPPHLPPAWRLASVLAAVAGTVAIASGATLAVHSIRLFIRLGRGTLAPWDPTRELVSVGAYRFSRNPLKAGLFLVLAGEALLARSPALAAWLVCFAITNVVYIRVHEEPGLRRRFGQRYRDYCALVPRWWPSLPALLARTAVAKEPIR